MLAKRIPFAVACLLVLSAIPSFADPVAYRGVITYTVTQSLDSPLALDELAQAGLSPTVGLVGQSFSGFYYYTSATIDGAFIKHGNGDGSFDAAICPPSLFFDYCVHGGFYDPLYMEIAGGHVVDFSFEESPGADLFFYEDRFEIRSPSRRDKSEARQVSAIRRCQSQIRSPSSCAARDCSWRSRG